MPFGPTNTPVFYPAMTKNMKDEWGGLFIERLRELSSIGGETVFISATMKKCIGNRKIVSGTKIIIDDIILWSSNIYALFVYLECICTIFRKHRVSFRLDKCDFLKPRVEYVGRHVTNDGICPASSKLSMINDWKIQERGESLFLFIGFINFYHRYASYMEIRLKPLRNILTQYYRETILLMAWSPDLILTFEELKGTITSSPVLARYDPLKPTF